MQTPRLRLRFNDRERSRTRMEPVVITLLMKCFTPVSVLTYADALPPTVSLEQGCGDGCQLMFPGNTVFDKIIMTMCRFI